MILFCDGHLQYYDIDLNGEKSVFVDILYELCDQCDGEDEKLKAENDIVCVVILHAPAKEIGGYCHNDFLTSCESCPEMAICMNKGQDPVHKKPTETTKTQFGSSNALSELECESGLLVCSQNQNNFSATISENCLCVQNNNNLPLKLDDLSQDTTQSISCYFVNPLHVAHELFAKQVNVLKNVNIAEIGIIIAFDMTLYNNCALWTAIIKLSTTMCCIDLARLVLVLCLLILLAGDVETHPGPGKYWLHVAIACVVSHNYSTCVVFS